MSDREIGNPVVIEIGNGEALGFLWAGYADSAPEGAVTVAKNNVYGVGGGVGENDVEIAVAIEVGNAHAHGAARREICAGELEMALSGDAEEITSYKKREQDHDDGEREREDVLAKSRRGSGGGARQIGLAIGSSHALGVTHEPSF